MNIATTGTMASPRANGMVMVLADIDRSCKAGTFNLLKQDISQATVNLL
jgi:hypothetical protein